MEEDYIVIGDDGCDVATTLVRMAIEAMYEGDE